MGIGSSGVVNCANTYLGTANYTVADGYVADRTVIVDGNGPAQLNLNFTRNEVLDPRITFSRTSNATRVNAQGLIETVAVNQPRFDYDPVTLAPKGLLIEEQRVNLIFPSISPIASSGGWLIGTGITTKVANDALSPDGTVNATSYTSVQGSSNSLSGTSIRWLNGITAAGSYTISFYAKGLTGGETVSVRFFDSGAAYDTTIACSVSDGGNNIMTTSWRRYYATATLPAGSVGFYSIIALGNNTDTTYIWGFQLEAGTFPTSYIPTTSAQVTRTADNASMTGTNFSSWYNQSEGTIYSEWMLGGDNISTSVYSISDGSASNLMRSRYNSAGTGIDNAVITSGATVAVLNATNQITTYSSYKNAMAYLVNDFARAANTVLVTDNSGAIPIVNQINIGASVGAVEQLNGHIQSIKYFNKRLLNSYLQSLTQ